MNKQILKIIITSLILFVICVFFTEAQQVAPDLTGELQPMSTTEGWLSYIFTIGSLFLFSIIVAFFINYFIVFFGLKILKIKEIPKYKIIFYALLMLLVSFLQLFINNLFLKDTSLITIYLISNFIYFGIIFLVIRYYFLLSGKDLHNLFFYIIAVNLFLRLLF